MAISGAVLNLPRAASEATFGRESLPVAW